MARYVHRFGPGIPRSASRETLGGKGCSLAEMGAAGFPVPPGFVISTECCRAFHASNRRWPEGLADEVREALAGVPEPRAVRSGAAASMPGMMDTLLNVRGDPSSAIEAVFDSWNGVRAARYRERHGLQSLPGTAVVVQAMFPSESSGVLFTEDPGRPDQGRIVIEASTGLGEAVVRGEVDPDRWVIDRRDLSIVEGRPGALTEDRAVELARLGLRVEAHFGHPVDVEWGLADGRFALLQSRPIAGLDEARAAPRLREEEIRRLAGGGPWAVSNLAETLPAPTPLTWDLVGRRLMGAGMIRLYRDLGYAPSARAEGFLELIAGRVYADLDRSSELFFGPYPLEYDTSGPDLLSSRPTRFNVRKAGALFLLRLPWIGCVAIRAARRLRRVARTLEADLEKNVFQKIRSEGTLEETERLVLDECGPELLKPGFLAAAAHARLAAILEQVFGPAEGRDLTARLLAGLDGDATVEMSQALYARPLEEFLAAHGHRAARELELSEPRFRESPESVGRMAQRLRRAPPPAELHERRKQERQRTDEALGGLLRDAGASSLEEEIRRSLADARRFLVLREKCKNVLAIGLDRLRRAIESLGLGPDVYFFQRSELSRPPGAPEIRARRIRHGALQRLHAPPILTAGSLDSIGRPPAPAPGRSWTGLAVSSGVGSGTARVILDPRDADLEPGSVLVCPSTDPAWAPLMSDAAALVVERGGMLSHGAIVARDLGLPAVVLPGATRLIPDGLAVRVDGHRGEVSLR
jgi:pyruvate,water dikinase